MADFQGRDFSEHAKLMFSCDFFSSKECLDERKNIFHAASEFLVISF